MHLQITRIVGFLIILMAFGACGPVGEYQRLLCFNNVHFAKRGDRYDGMAVLKGPLPDNLEITLRAGAVIRVSEITRESLVTTFGEPKVTKNSKDQDVERFGNDDCLVLFVAGKFESLSVGGSARVTNISSKKTLAFPVTESQIRDAFGKPTSVKRESLDRLPP